MAGPRSRSAGCSRRTTLARRSRRNCGSRRSACGHSPNSRRRPRNVEPGTVARSATVFLTPDNGDAMQVQPHLCFEGRCEEAVEFYGTALGAEVTFLIRFKEMPGPHPPGAIPPGGENKVMHTSFRVGGSTIL